MGPLTRFLIRGKNNINPVKHHYTINIFIQKASYAESTTEPVILPENDDSTNEETLKRIRNISYLSPHDYRKLHGLVPYENPIDEHHESLRWHRKQVGLYGLNCGYDPALCFTTKDEMNELQEYEKVAFDKSLKEIRENALKRQAEEQEERKLREIRVAENLAKTEAWKEEIRNRFKKKETEVLQAKEKREKLLEEVRRHFGYTIDTRDEKFQIMLEMREEEQRKKTKLEKKRRKEELLMSKLASLESTIDSKDKADENSKSEE